jgi:hypothetical protein
LLDVTSHEHVAAYHRAVIECSRCGRRHRTYRTLAECRYPYAAWVNGEGPWATLARCRAFTLTLHASEAEAVSAKAQIDHTGCGGKCSGKHSVVRLG